MANRGKIIFINLIIVFGIFCFSIDFTYAQPPDFVVEFEKTPLFSEANFLPRDAVSRWIKATNNSVDIFQIATKADNILDEGLGKALYLEIKQGSNVLYHKTLFEFFNDGEVFLSNLGGNGTQIQYDYNVVFYPKAGDVYQGKSLSFDILIGSQSANIPAGTYAFVGGGETTTTTLPGEVLGESIRKEPKLEAEIIQDESINEITATLSEFVAGVSVINPSICSVKLTAEGINPLLASLICFGQEMCKSPWNFWLGLLIGIIAIIFSLYFFNIKLLKDWIVLLIALLVIAYLLLFVLGVCLNPWIIFILGWGIIFGALFFGKRRN